ncbi:hypothetical protein N9N67_06265 [Bacteriovoracaceae bacterium]|nr:hypothetical protein [Bacteriovoracaceae bacterium]
MPIKQRKFFLVMIFIITSGLNSILANTSLMDQKFFCLANKFDAQKSEDNSHKSIAAGYCEKIKEDINLRIACLALINEKSDLKQDCPSDYPLCKVLADNEKTHQDCDKDLKKKGNSYFFCKAYKTRNISHCNKISKSEGLHYTCMEMLKPERENQEGACKLIGRLKKSSVDPLGPIDDVVSVEPSTYEEDSGPALLPLSQKKLKKPASEPMKPIKSATTDDMTDEDVLNLEL